MIPTDWQLQIPIDAVIFDCDGTLSRLEGIDELARMNGVGEAIEQLTAQAMGNTGINPQLYEQRLALVQPTHNQLSILGHKYFAEQVADIANVIQLLQSLQKNIYILSAGLYPAVNFFGGLLNIPQSNIFAVDIYFNSDGKYLDFDRSSPLITADGKKTIASELKHKYQRLLHIGDGLNDYATYDVVSRFVGYGGAFFHHKLAELCQYYISSPSMAALLPLCLTADEIKKLTKSEQQLYEKGLTLML